VKNVEIKISFPSAKKHRGKDLSSLSLPSRSNSWRSPSRVFQTLVSICQRFRAQFIGDACASPENALFPYYYTEAINAMQQAWFRVENALIQRNSLTPAPLNLCHTKSSQPQPDPQITSYWYINPPYGKNSHGLDLTDWLRKCALEAQKGVGVVALVPCPNGEVNRWHHVFGKAREVYFLSGRLCFGDPETGREDKPAKFGCVLIHWDPKLLCETCSKTKGDIIVDTKVFV
jgi:hypothetical protein